MIKKGKILKIKS